MRLRIKYRDRKTNITVDGNASFQELLQKTSDELNLPSGTFWLSLNGEDILQDLDKTLVEYGMVSGDLVKVLLKTEPHIPHERPSRPKLLDRHENDQKSPKESKHVNDDPLLSNNSTSQESDTCTNSMETRPTSCNNATTCTYTSSPGTSSSISNSNTDEGSYNKDISDIVNKYLNKPLTCQECTDNNDVPESLDIAYRGVLVKTTHEAVFVALHVLMAETGFDKEEVVVNCAQAHLKWNLPHQWNKQHQYSIHYTHRSCQGVGVLVNAVPLASVLVVHGHILGNQATSVNVKLKTTDFIADVNGKETKRIFRNLPKLSRLFKDCFVQPLYEAAREELGLTAETGILGLFPELKMKLMTFLDLKGLLSMSQVCKEFYNIHKEQVIWRKLYFKDFGYSRSNGKYDLLQNWKEKYKEQYIMWRESRKRAHVFHVAPEWNQPPYPLPHIPFYPPGVIGGDYDLNPQFQGIGGRLPRPRQLLPNPLFPTSNISVRNRMFFGGPRFF